MASAALWGGPIVIRFPTGAVVDGALITIFVAGTATPAVVYHDTDRVTPWTQPIETDATGSPGGLVFVSPTVALDIFTTDADSVAINEYSVLAWSPYALS